MCKINKRLLLKDQMDKGFTLVELITVVLIISILATLGAIFYQDIISRSADATAISEGKHLMNAVSDAFLSEEDVLFTTGGDVTGPIGNVKWSDGAVRSPIFTISPEIRARLTGHSTPDAGGGFLTFEVWSMRGSGDGTPSGKREYYFEIDETLNTFSIPSY